MDNKIGELETRIDIMERILDNKEPTPIVFEAKCKKCGETVAHVSHLATKVPVVHHNSRMAATTNIGTYDNRLAIKTCLNCSEITYREN